ncbi:MAG TPA: substrate-binding domain-containing protein [Chloroflexaceae bacterium]|nr:substrate-binding domain-containing protein [Chloroflexaceae bacterium]
MSEGEPGESQALYRQLADELAALIVGGALRAGQRLPTVRALAAERGLDPNTVNRAYLLLARRGLVEAHARRGTRVRAPAAPPPAAGEGPGPAVICAGSHDFGLDLLARQLRAAGLDLTLRPGGSTAGLRELAAGRAHMAGCHLLDDDGAGFNRDAPARLLPGRRLRLVTLAEREQGLIVPRGNPRGLRDLADVASHGLRLANRQAGSGTRALLDRLLAAAGVPGAAIAGYERELPTHLAVAAAVAGGSADAGLGVAAAARALQLDFIPLASERYDLVLPEESLAAPWFGPLIETLAAPRFRAAVETLGGYDPTYTAWIRPV